MTNLTDKWRKGELEKDKKYYTKDKLGRIYIKTYNKKGFKGLVEEVLCEVPSYEEWKNITDTLDYEYKGNLTLREENAKLNERIEKLEELLKECRKEYTGDKEYTDTDIVYMIDEALK